MKVKVFHIRLSKEYLQTDQDNLNNFLDSVTVKKTSTELVSGQVNFWSILVFYENQKPSDKLNTTDDTELNQEEKEIFEALKQWRLSKATQLNYPAYVICHNSQLIEIAKIKPQTVDELFKIKGLGESKIAKYGDDIIAVLNSI